MANFAQLVHLCNVIGVFNDGVDVRTIVIFKTVPPFVGILVVGKIDASIAHLRILNIEPVYLFPMILVSLLQWRRSYKSNVLKRVIIILAISVALVHVVVICRTKLLRIDIVLGRLIIVTKLRSSLFIVIAVAILLGEPSYQLSS